MKKNLLLFLLLISSICFSIVNAAVSASVDRTTVEFGDYLTLQIKSDNSNSKKPNLSKLGKDFTIRNLGQSSSIQITNGKRQVEILWTYKLTPKGLGKKKISPILVNGESTKPININVTRPNSNAKSDEDIFIETSVNKSTAYIQENINLTVKLFYRTLASGNLAEPTADGFVIEPLQKETSYQTSRGGKRYQVVERQYVIYAEKSGKLAIPPIVLKGITVGNRRDAFGRSIGGKNIQKQSNIISFNINPVPTEFVNNTWIPAKKVTAQRNWKSESKYQVGEPITSTVSIQLEGLSKSQIPELEFPEIIGAKSYKDDIQIKSSINNNLFIYQQTLTLVIIPNSIGDLVVPEYSLAWFNTQTNKKEIIKLPAKTFNIVAADLINNQSSTNSISNQNVRNATPNEFKLIPDNSNYWQWLTYLFASLWLATLVYFLTKKTKSLETDTKDKSNKVNNKAILFDLNSNNPKQIQNTVIRYWNKNNSSKVSNLSQIIKLIDSDEIIMELQALEKSMYNNSSEIYTGNIAYLVKSGKLKPMLSSKKIINNLPDLYS